MRSRSRRSAGLNEDADGRVLLRARSASVPVDVSSSCGIVFYSVINLNQFCEFSRSLFSVDARSCASPTPEELARRAPLDFVDDAGAAL